jgi:hypothetical protein
MFTRFLLHIIRRSRRSAAADNETDNTPIHDLRNDGVANDLVGLTMVVHQVLYLCIANKYLATMFSPIGIRQCYKALNNGAAPLVGRPLTTAL